MSLSQTLNAALSGLNAAARSAEVVASNLSNKGVASYGKREVVLATAPTGGVKVLGIDRAGNAVVIGERRIAQADLAATGTRAGFHAALEGWLGVPGTDGALTGRVDRLEAALITAAANPGAEAQLAAVLDAAGTLADGLRAVSDNIQQARQTADSAIRADVAFFNDALAKVADLNRTIVRMAAQGQDVAGLVDQRQALVDRIAEVIPLREVQREGGQIVLYSAGGATLLDGQPAVFGIAPAGVIRAESGPLPQITLNGQPAPERAFDGGRLAANLAIRDQIAPEAQARLDAVARDLAERLDAVEPGLFTDAGAGFDPADERGFSGRIRVNPLVDPGQGGALWRLRDGLGAAGPGDIGNGGLLTALATAIGAPRAPVSGDFMPGQHSLSDLVATVFSTAATARLAEESGAAHAASRNAALSQMEAEAGVDSDFELSRLLQIENAYGANARVIQAVDRMLATLLEM